MAANFHILVNHRTNSLHLKLGGDFDGTSACELLHMLEKIGHKKRKIIIDTNGLKRIYPFGRETFWKKLPSITHRPGNLVMTGKYDQQLAQ